MQDELISRQAVLDKKELVELEDGQSFYCISPEDVETLPPVTLQPKTGHWINHYDEDAKEGWYECDRCHTERAFNTKFCPDCGCCMVEVQEKGV